MSDGDRRISRRGLLRRTGSAALAGAPVFAGSASAASGPLSPGPSGVHAAFGPDSASSVRVGWSGPPASEARVEYGRPGDLDTTVEAEAVPVPGRDLVAYVARLSGLAPDAAYDYRAVQDGTASATFRVETAPDRAPSGFRVTAVGDHGIDDPENPFQRANTEDPVRVVERAAALDPAFHVGVGDIAYANGHPSTWERYFDAFESFFAETPFMTVPGNHEAEPGTGMRQYDARLNALMPTYDPLGVDDLQHRRRWYAVEYGDALFVGLSTTSDACGDVGRGEEYIPLYDPRCEAGGLTYGEAQERFLRRTLERASGADGPRWTVVFFHGPFWTDSPNHPPRQDLRERWGALFDEHGVDLVLSGDNHVFERSKPIVGTDWTRGYGTTYVTNGTGGTSHYPFASAERPGFLASRSNDYFGVTALDVRRDRIRLQYVDQEGAVRDAVDLVKDERGRPTQRPVHD